ncbi:ABC transporter ATP-binding protein [Niabella aquatica]
MMQIRQLKKSYGNFEVLDIADLELNHGTYWIKGSNGSGKSTFLKILAGLLPYKGQVLINNISLNKKPVAYRRCISYAPAEPVYPSFSTGNELVAFYCKVLKYPVNKTAAIKEMLGIDNYLGNPTGSYSSGMLKKLSLLLAFIGLPKWILLDEPFTTLDATTQRSLQHYIGSSEQAGFILTSHHDIDVEDIRFTGIYRLSDKQLVRESHS